MSNFKIIGPSNPEVGKEIIYKTSISNLPLSLPGQINPVGNNPFTQQVKWSIYILEYGKWVLKEKNNKTGPTANYTFTEKSLKRKGIRIVALFGDEKATIDIKPIDSIERKIVKVELCDALGNLQTKPFAYNQTVLARVHCLNLDNCTVHVTLWEDDAPGKGHDQINKNNKAITKSGLVANGIADVKFILAADFAKMADAYLAKGDTSEGKTHEYYVTAEIFRQKTESSNNINVINPNDKVADTKTAPKKPVADKPLKPKPTAPAAKKGPSKKEEKGIFDTVSGTIYDWGESKFKAIPTILPDPMEIVNSLATLFTPDKEDKKDEKGPCVCKESDLIWGNKVSCDFRKKVIEISKKLGLPQAKNEGANWLMAVMALETGRTFSPICGTFKKHKNDAKNGYVGLIQIGKVAAIDLGVKRSDLLKLSAVAQLEYVEKFFKQKKFDGKLKTKTDLYLAVNYPNACGHGTEKDYVVYDSTKDAYDDNPMFKREKDEYWIDKKGKKQYYEGKEGSSYVWEFEEAINDLYNEGIGEKVNFFGTCAIILNTITDKDVITYNIYSDGKIEKSIPKATKEGYENKYKYVYHDKNKREHSICILDWYNTKGKEVGTVHTTKPTHAEIVTDEKVSDGSTTRRVKYKNGDIAEYGKHPTKGLIWRLYKSTGNDIELIKMPDNLNYVRDGIVVKYSFSQTKRRYTGPNAFAGFIGALAECSYGEGITTTGSCFKEGSCFPSAEHVNGRSVDTIYYNDLKKDQAFVDAVIKFKFTEVLVGSNNYCKQISNAEDGGALHNSHLHSGNFNDESIIIKKQ
jgi:hypothetical protein